MEKIIFFFVFIVSSTLGLNAQSVEQKVINSSGNHFENDNQVTVSMGEAIIGHIKTTNYHVSVGFIQPFSLEAELVNGLEDELLAKVEIYPNPTTKYVNLKVSSLDAISSKINGVVYNETGIAVKEFVLETRGHIQQVDFSNLPGGVYMLKLSNKSRNNVYRIIKK
ncbi:hypothetical protein MNBD_BACTEROID06-1273 [hydrothermal vent metagenome]|uniref:Secretion system C-terminal sorting domain-containing protein n=1 Tax=hydrothermal vent metagenome TaxID=652676 RepID=A0A3B0V4R4_9ZZZZ